MFQRKNERKRSLLDEIEFLNKRRFKQIEDQNKNNSSTRKESKEPKEPKEPKDSSNGLQYLSPLVKC